MTEEIYKTAAQCFFVHMTIETPWGIQDGMHEIFIDENNIIILIKTACWSSFIQTQNYLLGWDLKKEDLKAKTPLLSNSIKPGDLCPQRIIDFWK